ncbi:MAG: hypothetical protein QM752_08170 [Gammaproteobacteria bacterium]
MREEEQAKRFPSRAEKYHLIQLEEDLEKIASFLLAMNQAQKETEISPQYPYNTRIHVFFFLALMIAAYTKSNLENMSHEKIKLFGAISLLPALATFYYCHLSYKEHHEATQQYREKKRHYLLTFKEKISDTLKSMQLPQVRNFIIFNINNPGLTNTLMESLYDILKLDSFHKKNLIWHVNNLNKLIKKNKETQTITTEIIQTYSPKISKSLGLGKEIFHKELFNVCQKQGINFSDCLKQLNLSVGPLFIFLDEKKKPAIKSPNLSSNLSLSPTPIKSTTHTPKVPLKLDIISPPPKFAVVTSKPTIKYEPITKPKKTDPDKDQRDIVRKLLKAAKENHPEDFSTHLKNVEALTESDHKSIAKKIALHKKSTKKTEQQSAEAIESALSAFLFAKNKTPPQPDQKKTPQVLDHKGPIYSQILDIRQTVSHLVLEHPQASEFKEPTYFFSAQNFLKTALSLKRHLLKHLSKQAKEIPIYFIGGFSLYLFQNDEFFTNKLLELDVDMVLPVHYSIVREMAKKHKIEYSEPYKDPQGKGCIKILFEETLFDITCDPQLDLKKDPLRRDLNINTIYFDDAFHAPKELLNALIAAAYDASTPPFIECCPGHLEGVTLTTLLPEWSVHSQKILQEHPDIKPEKLATTFKAFIDDPIILFRLLNYLNQGLFKFKHLNPAIQFCLEKPEETLQLILQARVALNKKKLKKTDSVKEAAIILKDFLSYHAKKALRKHTKVKTCFTVEPQHYPAIAKYLNVQASCPDFALTFKLILEFYLKTALETSRYAQIDAAMQLLFPDDNKPEPVYTYLREKIIAGHFSPLGEDKSVPARLFPLVMAIALAGVKMPFQSRKVSHTVQNVLNNFPIFEEIRKKPKILIDEWLNTYFNELAAIHLSSFTLSSSSAKISDTLTQGFLPPPSSQPHISIEERKETRQTTPLP